MFSSSLWNDQFERKKKLPVNLVLALGQLTQSWAEESHLLGFLPIRPVLLKCSNPNGHREVFSWTCLTSCSHQDWQLRTTCLLRCIVPIAAHVLLIVVCMPHCSLSLRGFEYVNEGIFIHIAITKWLEFGAICNVEDQSIQCA